MEPRGGLHTVGVTKSRRLQMPQQGVERAEWLGDLRVLLGTLASLQQLRFGQGQRTTHCMFCGAVGLFLMAQCTCFVNCLSMSKESGCVRHCTGRNLHCIGGRCLKFMHMGTKQRSCAAPNRGRCLKFMHMGTKQRSCTASDITRSAHSEEEVQQVRERKAGHAKRPQQRSERLKPCAQELHADNKGDTASPKDKTGVHVEEHEEIYLRCEGGILGRGDSRRMRSNTLQKHFFQRGRGGEGGWAEGDRGKRERTRKRRRRACRVVATSSSPRRARLRHGARRDEQHDGDGRHGEAEQVPQRVGGPEGGDGRARDHLHVLGVVLLLPESSAGAMTGRGYWDWEG